MPENMAKETKIINIYNIITTHMNNILNKKIDNTDFAAFYIPLLIITLFVPFFVFISLPIIIILTIQRLNDIGISRKYALLMPIPIIGFGLAIYLFFKKSA